MGFYGMIFGFFSLGSTLIVLLQVFIGTPLTIALGGAIIAIFGGGSWLISPKVRQLLVTQPSALWDQPVVGSG